MVRAAYRFLSTRGNGEKAVEHGQDGLEPRLMS